MASSWPKWSDMNWLRLMEGPANLTVLPIAPTMTKVVHKGETYNRMPDTRSPVHPGEDADGLTGYGGAYLWDGWLAQKIAENEARRAEAQS